MGHAIRQYNAFRMRLYQGLKRKIVGILSLMRPGFTNDHFVEEFNAVYPNDWKRLNSYHDYYGQKDRLRPGKKFDFPQPRQYLLDSSFPLLRNLRQKHEKGACLSPEQQAILRNELVDDELRRQRKREAKIQRQQEVVQSVAPQYLQDLKAAYGESDPQKRLDIVKEMAKYRHPETISFLYGILSGERDYFIRQEAFFALQRFGNVVFLPGKRDGKKDKQDRLLEHYGGYTGDLGKGPSDVLREFANDSVQNFKEYDVFLSHSTNDHEKVLDIVSELNALNQVVYVDWISDKEDLNRGKANEDTARVLMERMRRSKCLVLIRTQNSDRSPWIAWELGFFAATNCKLCVFDLEESLPSPEFVAMHPKLIRTENRLLVNVEDRNLTFLDWLSEVDEDMQLPLLPEA